MAVVGSAALIVALVTALYAAGAALVGARTARPQLVASARRAIFSVAGVGTPCVVVAGGAGLCALCVVVLEVSYVRSDFSFALVANNSSTDTPLFYRLTPMWSSQPGS